MSIWKDPPVKKLLSLHMRPVNPAPDGRKWESSIEDVSEYIVLGDRHNRVATFGGLQGFVKAAKLVAKRCKKEFGAKFWERAEEVLARSPRDIAYLKLFRRIVHQSQNPAVTKLVMLRKRGLSYRPVGGDLKADHPRDHGVEHLAEVIDTAICHLRNARSPVTTATDRGQCYMTSDKDGKTLRLTLHTGSRQRKGPIAFSKNASSLLLALMDWRGEAVQTARNNRPDEFLWNAVWPGEAYHSGKGVPVRLRDLVRTTSHTLAKHFGPPPGGGRWIARETNAAKAGYYATAIQIRPLRLQNVISRELTLSPEEVVRVAARSNSGTRRNMHKKS